MKQPIKVGQKMWANPEGPNSSRKGDKSPIEVEVVSIGRKFLTVKDEEGSWRFSRSKFYIDTLREDNGNYSPEWRLYHFLEEIQEREERAKLERHISAFNFRSLNLEQLRRVRAIIQEE